MAGLFGMTYRLPLFAFLLTAMAFLLAPPSWCAADARQERNVLIVLPYSHEYPATKLLIKGLQEGFERQDRYKVNYSYEFLGLHQLPANEDFFASTARYFQGKYAGRKPDIVITGAVLSHFMASRGNEMFPGVPILVPWWGKSELPEGLRKHCYVVSASIDYASGLDLILKVDPKVRRVLAVVGASAGEKLIAGLIKRAAEKYRDRLEVLLMDDLTKEDMLGRVRAAGEGSVILYCGWVKDVAGETYVPTVVAKEICREAKVPVYSVEEQFLGLGIVGGNLFSFGLFGQICAQRALDVLDGKASLGQEDAASVSEYLFDWRALKRFRIAEGALPQGSRIEYREPSIWDLYKGYILAGLGLVLLEGGLIIGLLVNRARRRKVESQLISLNNSLEQIVLERTKELRESNDALTQAKTRLEEMNRRLDFSSRTDSLTGLYNRRHIEEILDREHVKYLRTGELYSIVLCDLDFFKQVNDAHGHDAGDFLLREVALDLTGSIRPYDTPARWGGEEFILFLPGTDTAGATAIAERIRERINQRAYSHKGAELRLTVTVGLATPGPGDTVSTVVKRADTALYEGKRAGRNRVVTS